MKLLFTDNFKRAFRKVPEPVRRAFEKQSDLLLQNMRHRHFEPKNTARQSKSGRPE